MAGPVTTQTLREGAASPITFTCATIDSGKRLGGDRDEDLVLNGDDCAPADGDTWAQPVCITDLLLAKQGSTVLSWDDQGLSVGPSVRYDAVMALSRILNAKELVPVLADALFDEPSSHVKLTIMRQLNAVGRPAVKALPALRRLLRDQDERVRLAAKDLIEAVESLPKTKRKE